MLDQWIDPIQNCEFTGNKAMKNGPEALSSSDRESIIDAIVDHIHHLSKLSAEELEHILDCLTLHGDHFSIRRKRNSVSEEM
jgi:hypothetical protein